MALEKIFVTAAFKRFAKKEKISNDALISAITDASNGLIDADLGGGIIKQRIARTGQGKSGGYRSIIAFQQGNRAFFIHGYAKNVQENITPNEMNVLKILAKSLRAMSDKDLQEAITNGKFMEIPSDD